MKRGWIRKKRKEKRGRKEYSFAVVEVTEVTLKFRGILQIAICNAAKEKLLPPPASSHNSNNARNECWTRNKNYFLMQRRNTKILLIFTNSNILYHFEHEYFIVKRNIEPLLFFSYKFFFLRFWLSIEINKMRTINFDWTRLRSILIRNSSKLLESLQPLPLFHRARISSMYKPRLIFNIFANE